MAGKMRLGAVAALTLAASVGSLFAQTPTPAPQTPAKLPKTGAPWLGGKPADSAPSGPAYENVRKALDALTPEQRKRFQENFVRWMNLSPEEKKAMRDREDVRKKWMEQEIEVAIQESGLQLEGERREQFMKRYAEGRRAIEEQLRKELNEKRKPMVHELIGRLKNEFSGEAPATGATQTIQTASPTPTASATPTAKP
jgi:hypothetical protein